MAAKYDAVWAWLVRVALWPSWYPNSANIVFLNGEGPDLALGKRFRWKTFGVTVESAVLEFVPYERIAWDAKGFGVDAYHAWLVEPRGEKESFVLTQEHQDGLMARLNNIAMPNRMYRHHQIWLEKLGEMAKGGLPPNAEWKTGS
jgi:hypothetical protein